MGKTVKRPFKNPFPPLRGKAGMRGALPSVVDPSPQPSPARGEGALNAVWRLLDANANRAREALRVVEDTARFVLNRADAAQAFRGLRHDFDRLVRGHYQPLVGHRDVERDTGRFNPAKPYRGGVPELVVANLKRCEEALRVFEEYGRVISPQTVRQAQALRFQVYEWEKRLLQHP